MDNQRQRHRRYDGIESEGTDHTLTSDVDDRSRGLYNKYRVERIGGTPGKHEHCMFFVLDVDHDPFAIPALIAYESFATMSYPKLASDIRQLIDSEHLRDHADHDHKGTHEPAGGADGRDGHAS